MQIKTKWFVTPPWQGTVIGETFATLEKTFALSGIQITSDKQSSVIKTEVDGQNFYVKRYHKSTGLRSWIGRARIRLETRNQLWFKQIGLPAAAVVAYGEEYLGGKTFRGVLITKEQVGTKDLAWLARNKPEYFRNSAWVASIIYLLAEITSTLHDHGFCHNDLKWRNILASHGDELPKLYLIDCPTGQRWPRFLLKRRIIKDLACLDKMAKYHLTRTQRLRFFLTYRKAGRLTAVDKKMIRQVLFFFEGRE